MPFSRSSLTTIIDRIVSDLESRITGATSLLRRSFLRVIAKVLAGAIHLLYEFLDYQAKQLFISTADGAGLDAHAAEYGMSRNDSIEASGSGEASGTNGVLIPADSELISTDSIIYTVDTDATIAGGVATIAFTAESGGEDGNDDAGITLSFVSPITGVNTSVTVDSDGITSGGDQESDTDLRARLLRRKSYPPHGGSEFDYEAWCLEVSGVTRAWIFPLYLGSGTVGVAFVRDNDTNIIPTAAQLTTVREYLVEHEDPITGIDVGIQVTAEPGLTMIELSLLSIDMTISISPNSSAIRALVTTSITELFEREGGPGETVYLSEIDQAISLTQGLNRHTLDSPVVDQTAGQGQIHTVGTLTFSDY